MIIIKEDTNAIKQISENILNIELGKAYFSDTTYKNEIDSNSLQKIKGKYIDISRHNTHNIIILPNGMDKNEFVESVENNIQELYTDYPELNKDMVEYIRCSIPFLDVSYKTILRRHFITNYSSDYKHSEERHKVWIIIWLSEYNCGVFDEETIIQMSPDTILYDKYDMLATSNIDILRLDHFKGFNRYSIVMHKGKPCIPIYKYSVLAKVIDIEFTPLLPFHKYIKTTESYSNPEIERMVATIIPPPITESVNLVIGEIDTYIFNNGHTDINIISRKNIYYKKEDSDSHSHYINRLYSHTYNKVVKQFSKPIIDMMVSDINELNDGVIICDNDYDNIYARSVKDNINISIITKNCLATQYITEPLCIKTETNRPIIGLRFVY